jgi:predicted DNA-binding antitoxin AbrB/MazE fold protein
MEKDPPRGLLQMMAGWRRMAKHIEVIYTQGVFRPAAPLELELREGQHIVFLLLEKRAELKPFVEDDDVRQWCAEQAGEHVARLEDVRQMLSKIPGSMADAVIAERDERF